MKTSERIAMAGVLCALAFGLSYIEMLIPFDFAIPGMKLGLANAVVLVAMYKLKAADALAVNLVRVLLVGILFGNPVALAFSVSGAILSFVVMYLLKKYTGMHITVISIAGALAHIIGQLCVGLIFYNPTVLFYYSMFLLVAACISGLLLGIVAGKIIKSVKPGD